MFSGYQGSAAPYAERGGQIVYSGATANAPFQVDQSRQMSTSDLGKDIFSRANTIQVDQSRQMSTSDLGKDIFSRANPGAQGYVSSASPGNRHGPVQHGLHHAGWRQRRQEFQRGI